MSDNHSEDKSKDCLVYLESFFKCCTVDHQFGKIYRDSLFDNCNSEVSMFKNCILAKTVTDSDKKEEYLKKLQKDFSNENKIFVLKESPSWLNTDK